MNTHTSICLILFLSFFTSFAQNNKKDKQTLNNSKTIQLNYYDDISEFVNGYARVYINKKGYGFINKLGKEVVQPIYHENRGNVNGNGLVIVQKKFLGKYGMIDMQNKIIIPFEYDEMIIYNNSYVVVSKNVSSDNKIFLYKKGVYKLNGLEFIKPIYDDIQPIQKNLFLIKKSGIYRLINEKQTVIHTFKNSDIVSPCGEYLFKVMAQGKFGIVDTTGNEIVPKIYDLIYSLNKDGFIKVLKDGKYGFLDRKGKEVIPIVYEDCENMFSEDLLAVKLKNQWGFVDRNNRLVIDYWFCNAHNFSEGTAFVKTYFASGFINKQSLLLNTIPYIVYDFSDGLAKTQIDGNTAFVNKQGQIVMISDIKNKPKVKENNQKSLPEEVREPEN